MKYNLNKTQMVERRRFVITFSFLLLTLFTFSNCGDSEDTSSPLPDPKVPVEIVPDPGMDLYGFIGDKEGNPIPDVVISDGFNCVKTNKDGVYQMEKNNNATFVYYSTPSAYEVNTASSTVKVASFYKKIRNGVSRYDFKLVKLPQPEKEFTILCIGDPQVKNENQIKRFETETMKDIKGFVEGHHKPVYALAMGDITGDKPELFQNIKRTLGSSVSLFVTIGNHDKVATDDKSQPRISDEFSDAYGPVNYSFDRGDVHFVCLDNVIYENASSYKGGFTDDQVEWLKQDLSYVPKDKMIIMYYHIPLRHSKTYPNRVAVMELLKGFRNVHLMCGHTHYNENFMVTNPVSAYEHIHGAACGAWWYSVINGDGTPNGYGVYEIKGNNIANWFYKAVNYDKNFQMRLHRGNASFGGEKGYFTYGESEDMLMVNAWNADSEWTFDVYEDEKKTGQMEKSSITKDAWSQGYHIGIVGRNPDSYSQATKHLYIYKLKNPKAKVKVVATDRFGNVYTEDKITTNLNSAGAYTIK